MEKVNLEREKSGLQPRPVMEFDEWIETHPLNATEIKLFKKYKASTTKDLRAQEGQTQGSPTTETIKSQGTNPE
jgi:hypothetical protein